MDGAFGLMAVTAVLKHVLDNGLARRAASSHIGDVIVTALPPDRVNVGADERGQLNLYLYRVTPNSGWRRLPVGSAREPVARRPLVLDLHYLLSVYGERDFQAEILLGSALAILGETPRLTRDTIRAALAPPPLGTGHGSVHPAFAAAPSDLADHVAEIVLTPEFLAMDELSKLWSGFQARYRLSATYSASLALIGNNPIVATGPQAEPRDTLHELRA